MSGAGERALRAAWGEGGVGPRGASGAGGGGRVPRSSLLPARPVRACRSGAPRTLSSRARVSEIALTINCRRWRGPG
ncbi:unnamed protein product, partial [Iphiclides podalirius]